MRAARYLAFPSRAASIRNLRSLAFDNLKIFERRSFEAKVKNIFMPPGA
jgi:hypothetical protein